MNNASVSVVWLYVIVADYRRKTPLYLHVRRQLVQLLCANPGTKERQPRKIWLPDQDPRSYTARNDGDNSAHKRIHRRRKNNLNPYNSRYLLGCKCAKVAFEAGAPRPTPLTEFPQIPFLDLRSRCRCNSRSRRDFLSSVSYRAIELRSVVFWDVNRGSQLASLSCCGL